MIILIPLLVAYYYILRYVRHTSIEVQRLEANARSPVRSVRCVPMTQATGASSDTSACYDQVYSTFSEILQGLVTVRAYGQQKRFQEIQNQHLNVHLQPYYIVRVALNAWLQLRLNVLGGMIAFSVACLCTFTEILPAGIAAVTLMYSLMSTRFLFFVVFMTTQVEVRIASDFLTVSCVNVLL